MTRKPSKTLIGMFVLGAIALIAAGVTTFGAGKYLSRQPTFVMFFEGSVKGLNVGSPVVFKGVKVGRVSDISLLYNQDTQSVQIPVLVEIDPHTIIREKGWTNPKDFINLLIGQGLRAQLQLQNLLTGQLLIELDFHPDKPSRLVRSEARYPEIPTIPSSLEQLSKTIEKIPMEELVTKLISAIEGVEKAVTSPELTESIRSLNLALNDVRSLVKNLDGTIGPLSSDIMATLEDTRNLVRDFGRHAESLQESIDRASDATRKAMEQAEKTFGALEHASAADSPVMFQLSRTLDEISATADSIRALSDYLNRHPEAMLRGKGE
ncbi:MAG TPA: MlaD family protein [Deltaproteobacteria bacterium]|jgi:paraquat-inducible protein B|nr:MCE family protein [Deltaproteobacteria bacterium]OQC23100.1 MAG: Paraquat-inducible protein B [Deltaproteobacteria bacterium ADurb.Bin072]HRW80195.1 MlaD family protein [Desulfomonilia bacterium]HNQ86629.1 MlaD family protein [Deltaproteobacteria bacterium]HNS89105.1 MlaD family protein [Deltaproteobacteria bacterium]